MSEARKGDWIQTYTGVKFYPLDPRREEINITDIAHALSLQCRFGGHVDRFYSVAQHSVMVSHLAFKGMESLRNTCWFRHVGLWGLLHDASEAYLVDLPSPIKYEEFGKEYRRIERGLMDAVAQRFELMGNEPDCVKSADRVALFSEKKYLLHKRLTWGAHWGRGLRTVQIETPWNPEQAERKFLERFRELTNGDN